MNGMEMMVNMLIKSAGVDPEAIKKDAADFIAQLKNSINNFDGRLKRLELMQQMNNDELRNLSEQILSLRITTKEI